MNDLTDQVAYTALGSAVIASQVFEAAFVTAAKLALQQPDAQTIEDIVPLSISKSFKQPITAILRELNGSGVVDATLESRVTRLVEQRHRIIHRQFLQGTWPGRPDSDDRLVFYNTCIAVTKESTALAVEFADLLLGWMDRIAALESTAEKHRPGLMKLAESVRAMQTRANDSSSET
jgi:hypothetical protein